MKLIFRIAALPLALGLTPVGPALGADPFTIASYPLFLAPAVKPNLMVIFDNSQSMDATMSGKIISGNLPETRGNVARGVLRSVITTNRDKFNWGLTAFDIDNVELRDIYAYYIGNSTTMVYTADCVAGVSASNAGRRCLPNPAGGSNFLTYDRSGDDSDINDVTYANHDSNVMYGVGQSGTTYGIYDDRDNASGTGWANSDFDNFFTNGTFSATDAGFVSSATTYPRRLWLKRGWGYRSDINGSGEIVRTVQADSDTHYTSLMNLLAVETDNVNSGEIKNAASRTPLAGSLDTVKNYFRQGESSSRRSPVSETCQANFVVLATDGNPTAKTNGTPYSDAEREIVRTPPTGDPAVYTFGTAQQHVFDRITGLRSTVLNAGDLSNNSLNGRTYDIKTYVVGMGDSVANDKSVAALNEMARLGGTGKPAFLGNSATSLATAFESIVGDIEAKTSSASAAAVNAGSWNSGSRVYQAKFNSVGWSGNLLAYPVSSTGVITQTPTWEASERIQLLSATQRKIITYKPSGNKGVAFRWPSNPASPTTDELDASQIASLNTNASGSSDVHGAARLAFLRGDASREPRNCAGCSAPVFRNRIAGPLGDIVNSAPYYVSKPISGYDDDSESAPYSSFAFTHRNRTPVIYVGANDGMLHAFNADTGDEMLAYVPSALYSELSKLSGSTYTHRYYVDGSPTVGDVFYNGNWHTLLVSGMRSGARGLFALDVTAPGNFSEGNAASIVRWEFQHSDLGHVYGQPLLVKTNNGRWSVIVSGGYNVGNSNGRAKLFVIDAETGALTTSAPIDTGSGTAASPNGLSAPAAVDSNGDGVVDLVYAGDLNGNLWKFDLTSADPAVWALGNANNPLFAAGANQPVTGTPDVTRSPKGGFLIGFGTGRYIATTDNNTPAELQRIYVVRDSLSAGTVVLADLQAQTVLNTVTTDAGLEFRLSSHAVGAPGDVLITTKDNLITRTSFLDTKKGWYLTLPTSGERVVTDASFRAGRLIATSMIPDSSTPCAAGGSGWLLEFDAVTGNRLGSPTFDNNDDSQFSVSDFIPFAGSPTGSYNVSGVRIQGLPATPSFVGSGKIDIHLVPHTGKNTANEEEGEDKKPDADSFKGSLGAARDGRAMWREVR